MATWIPEMVDLLKAVDRSPTPPGNVNCATYLAAVDNISKVCAAAQETVALLWITAGVDLRSAHR